jgi:hypothetical protein
VKVDTRRPSFLLFTVPAPGVYGASKVVWPVRRGLSAKCAFLAEKVVVWIISLVLQFEEEPPWVGRWFYLI